MDRFGVGSLSCYDSLDQVGEGTYGYVYKARDIRNKDTVALKRLIFHRESSGFPLCAVREIKFLKSLQHKNIVALKDIITSKGCDHLELPTKTDVAKGEEDTSANKQSDVGDYKRQKNENQEKENMLKESMKICGNLYLVFEFIEHDIGGLIDAKYKFPVRAIKSIMKQLFEVLDFLNDKKIIHRDIKSSNILITNRHQVKLADFGLARSVLSSDGRESRVDLTNNVITMWYKPPELLLGAVRYGSAVDMWSAGCVLAELELGRPLFPGKAELEQLDLICRALGTPGEDVWPGISNMSNYAELFKNLPKYTSTLKISHGSKLSEATVNMLERILVVDPARRSSAKIALTNKYFQLQPMAPLDPTDLEPLNVEAGASYHEYKTKQARKQRDRDEETKRSANAKEQDSIPNQAPVPPPPGVPTSLSGALLPAPPNPFTSAALVAPPPFRPPPGVAPRSNHGSNGSNFETPQMYGNFNQYRPNILSTTPQNVAQSDQYMGHNAHQFQHHSSNSVYPVMHNQQFQPQQLQQMSYSQQYRPPIPPLHQHQQNQQHYQYGPQHLPMHPSNHQQSAFPGGGGAVYPPNAPPPPSSVTYAYGETSAGTIQRNDINRIGAKRPYH